MSELNNLIPISYDNPERPTVSGRELHEFLQVKTAYKDWFPRMVEYGFTMRVRISTRSKLSGFRTRADAKSAEHSMTTSSPSRWPKSCA